MGHPGVFGWVGRCLGSFVRFGGGGGGFADDFGGGLVFAEAEEGGLADEVVGGPGGGGDLGDEGGLDPVGAAAGFGWWFFEWRGGLGQGFQLVAEQLVGFLGEAGAG